MAVSRHVKGRYRSPASGVVGICICIFFGPWRLDVTEVRWRGVAVAVAVAVVFLVGSLVVERLSQLWLWSLELHLHGSLIGRGRERCAKVIWVCVCVCNSSSQDHPAVIIGGVEG
jgi:hypothetical protein